MREKFRRLNFKIGDPCDGFNPSRVICTIFNRNFRRHRLDTNHLFYEQYYTTESYMLKQTVYGSKLVGALCES